MILTEFYKRHDMEPEEDLSKGGVGITGVGSKLLDLQKKSQGASVKAMAAANEIKQMENEDLTDMNRIELTLNAAKKKALKQDGSKALEEKKRAEKLKEEEKRRLSRNSLKEKAALWEGK